MALLVFVLCQPVHSCIEPSQHGLDFFLEIFLWRLVSVFLIKYFNNLLCGTAHVIAVDARVLTNGVQQPVRSSTLSLPHKKAQVVSPSCAQSKAQMDHLQRIS